MKRLFHILFLLLFVSLQSGCISDNKTNNNNFNSVIIKNNIQTDTILVKDRIDTLIDERAVQKFKGSIFAGLRFGDSRQKVKTVLKNKRNLDIQVPIEDEVRVVHVSTYDAVYYNDKLASLTLYAEEDELYYPLIALYTTKYSETKNSEWQFANCKIDIRHGWRINYNPSRDAGYGGTSIMYHNSFRGERTESLTNDPAFLKINYENKELLEMKKIQEKKKDSLEHVRYLQEKEMEKELARKLLSEPATNI